MMNAPTDRRTKLIVTLICSYIILNCVFKLVQIFGTPGNHGMVAAYTGWLLASAIGTLFYREKFRQLLVVAVFIISCVGFGILLFTIISPSAFMLTATTASAQNYRLIVYGLQVITGAGIVYFLQRPATKRLFHRSSDHASKS